MDLPEILLVDDEEGLLSFLTSVLRPKYTIRCAENGFQALEILEKGLISLVVSDIMMPVMDGFELCRRIKSSPETSHIPVVLLTARNTLQSRIEGLEFGADAYIDKPFSPSHLRVQIANLLENRRKIWDYFSKIPLTKASTLVYTQEDGIFIENATKKILDQIDNAEFGPEQLADAVNMSRITLYRKIKTISNLTPLEFIHITRLKKGAELLASKKHRVFEVAMMVGYKSQTHFGRVFQKQFGVTPTQFIDTITK